MPRTFLARPDESLSQEGSGTVARRVAEAVGARLVRIPDSEQVTDVFRRMRTPVLAVAAGADRGWPDKRQIRVLVPLDGSAAARAALGPAVELVRLCGASLILVRVVEPPPALVNGDPGPALAAEVELAGARGYLHGLALELPKHRLSATVHACLGPPAEMILCVARAQGADLIVLTSHGLGGRADAALGSVAAAILERASVPVLLVRPPRGFALAREVAAAQAA